MSSITAEIGATDQEFVAQTFDQVRARFRHFLLVEIIVKNRADRIDRDDVDVRIPFLQKSSHAADGPPGPDSGDKIIDPPVHLLPDFGAGRAVMGVIVLTVVVLIGEITSAGFPGNPGRDVVVAVGGFGRQCVVDHQDVDTQGLELVQFLGTDAVPDHDLEAISFLNGDERQTERGIARGIFDDQIARFQPPLFFGRFDHVPRDPILAASHRV